MARPVPILPARTGAARVHRAGAPLLARAWLAALLAALLAAACATRAARIAEHQALFESYPEPIQQAIREGRVEVGFTEEMVYMALGEPDEVRRRIDEAGETVIWAYRSRRPGIGIGIGGGTYGGFGGVRIDPSEIVYDAVLTFEQGVVTAIELREE